MRPDRWLGRLPRVETEDAEREIVRRFLAAYGPATADDVRRWLGMSVAKLKRMLRALEDELVEVEFSGSPAWLLARDADVLRASPKPKSVRLLPAFDPYVVGFRPRSLLVDAEHEPRIFRPQAWFSPVVLVDGRAAGIWERERRGRRLEVRVEPFSRLSAATRHADRGGDGAPR